MSLAPATSAMPYVMAPQEERPMNLSKLIACVMLLGLLSGVSFAQRGRLNNGGTVPGARLPNAWTPSSGTSHTPTLGTTGPNTQKVQPNTTTSPAAKTVSPNANTNPTHASPLPNSRDWGNARGVGPAGW